MDKLFRVISETPDGYITNIIEVLYRDTNWKLSEIWKWMRSDIRKTGGTITLFIKEGDGEFEEYVHPLKQGRIGLLPTQGG